MLTPNQIALAYLDSTLKLWNLSRKHFHIFRHWKLTNYAYVTRDFFLTQQFGRQKDAKSTQYYIDLARVCYNVKTSDEWTVRYVKTVEEVCELVKVGFEHVTDIEGFKVFRKRK